MTVPAFSFTSRAVPIAQIGRIQPVDWFPEVWVDIGCDVHTITTDTGRGSASDRFVPGTAVITASNVSGWANAVTPLEWTYFTDDFNRSGPALDSRWEPRPLVAADELVIVDGAAEVPAQPVYTPAPIVSDCTVVSTHQATASVLTESTEIGPFTAAEVGDLVVLSLQVQRPFLNAPEPILDGYWEKAPPFGHSIVGGMDQWAHYYYVRRVNAAEAELNETWTASWKGLAGWTWIAVVVRGAGSVRFGNGSTTFWATGTAGHFEDITSGSASVTALSDGSIGVRFRSGEHPHNFAASSSAAELVHATIGWDGMQYMMLYPGMAAGATLGYLPHPWTSATTAVAGETTQGWVAMFTPGAYPVPDGLPMQGAGCALWEADFPGNQYVEATVSGLRAPDELWPASNTRVELALMANTLNLAAKVAVFDWVPDWDDPAFTGRLSWRVERRAPDGSVAATIISGIVDYGAEGFPASVRFRFEVDVALDVRVFLDGGLLGSGSDPPVPLFAGQRIGIFASFFAGGLSYGRTDQMGPPRFEQVTGGSNIPVPIYLEPGVLVRIGVDHQVYGVHWLFHGYVDAIVPVYDPVRQAVANIECIDALGEMGRLPIEDIGGVDPEEAWERVWRLVSETTWPPAWAEVDDDATWMSNQNTRPDRAIELLTQTAESCGGAMFGDPETGHIVFRARDWQAWDPDDPPHGWITNGSHPSAPGILAVCPSTWERSWRREDMTTRISFGGGYATSGFYTNPEAEARYGIEAYERTLVCVEQRILDKLGHRQLKLRGPGAFPRVAAVNIAATTGDAAVDMLTLTTFTLPSRYQCGLVIDGQTVFDRQYLVTGLRHTIERDSWTCRMELDIADVFATNGARWGKGHWSRPGDVWGHSI